MFSKVLLPAAIAQAQELPGDRLLRVDTKMRIAATALLILFAVIAAHRAIAADEQICDAAADIALGTEDYPTAITLHKRLLRLDRNDALAHYHLGFAYGMVGRTAEEIKEYLEAISLGLDKWDLFLNLGQAYLDHDELAKATVALETAVSLGPEHAETHFNLAIVYERENKLRDASQEITASRNLAPEDLDAANMNAVICAEMGDFACAHDVWKHLVRAAPDYLPARANLVILNRWYEVTNPFARRPQPSFSRAEVTASHAVLDRSFGDSEAESEPHLAPNVLTLEPVYKRER